MRARASLTFVFGAVFGATLVAVVGVAEARSVPPPKALASVVATKDTCTVIAPSKKARATPLVEGKNAYLGRLELDPGAKVPKHRDPTEEYIHVLSGAGTMVIDGKTYPVTTGSTIYMPANAEVSFDNGPTSMTAIQVFAGPAPAKKYEKWTGCAGR